MLKKFEVKKGKELRNFRLLIYGVEGVGKSTFASLLPDPLFIDIEDRIRHLDVCKVRPKSWGELLILLESIKELIKENGLQTKTIVVDSIDWCQKLACDYVLSKSTAKIQSIEDFGYGKGYTYIYEEMLKMLRLLDKLNECFHIACICHSIVSKFEDPFGNTYDRYTLKLLSGQKTSVADTFKEWSDYMFFLNYRPKDKNTDERVIYTNRTSLYDGKRSRELPDVVVFTKENAVELINKLLNYDHNTRV